MTRPYPPKPVPNPFLPTQMNERVLRKWEKACEAIRAKRAEGRKRRRAAKRVRAEEHRLSLYRSLTQRPNEGLCGGACEGAQAANVTAAYDEMRVLVSAGTAIQNAKHITNDSKLHQHSIVSSSKVDAHGA